MENKTFTLLVGCGDSRSTITIKNQDDIELWNEHKIRQTLSIDPEDVTGILIGKGLVIELFSDAYFSQLENVLENNTEPKGHKYEIGCILDHQSYKGSIRSFKVWMADEYHTNGRLVKYCDKNDECSENEFCLCPGGEKKKEWCPDKRKRCLNKRLFFHDAKRTTWNPDLINSECMLNLIDTHNNPWPEYRELKNMAKLCQQNPRKPIEGFGEQSDNIMIYIVLFMIIYFLMKN
jgi:hypothetical protein